MAKLPYFKWYPADAESDDFYASLTDSEGWMYHRLLNRSWINDGIPSKIEEIARVIGKPAGVVKKAWPKLSQRWTTSPRDPEKLVNPRQELERANAIATSENNKRPGNANAKGSRRIRNANDTPRAYECEYVSGSESQKRENSLLRQPTAEDLNGQTSQNFAAWFAAWEAVRGNAYKPHACQAYISSVTTSLEADALECARSYVSGPGRDPAKGYRPDNFIFEMRRDEFKTRWPAAAPQEKPALTPTERLMQKAREEKENGRRS